MDKKILGYAVIGASLLLIGAGCAASDQYGSAKPGDNAVTSPPTAPPAYEGGPAAGKSGVKANGAVTLAYDAALKIYQKSGFYFQFANCQVIKPSPLTLKAGIKFMLDNRDADSHVFAFGNQSYQLAPYGFAVVNAPYGVGVHQMTCDGGGAASVNIEK